MTKLEVELTVIDSKELEKAIASELKQKDKNKSKAEIISLLEGGEARENTEEHDRKRSNSDDR